MSSFISDLFLSFIKYTFSRERLIKDIKMDFIVDDEFKKEFQNNVYLTPDYKLWFIVNDNKILYYFCKVLSNMDFVINPDARISRLIYYFPYILLLLAIIYNIHQGVLFHEYFALFYLFITSFIKKIRKFYYEKFSYYDEMFAYYLYNKDGLYFYSELITDKRALEIYLRQIEDEFMEYILSGFKSESFRKYENGHRLANIDTKRIWLILLSLCSSLYFYYLDKYIFTFSFFNINLSLFCLIMSIILYIVYRNITNYDENNIYKENALYKWIFRILVVPFALLILYIIIKNIIILFPQEVIFNFCDLLHIEEMFKLQDKLNYIDKYIDYLEQTKEITKQQAESLLTKCKEDLMKDKRNVYEKYKRNNKNAKSKLQKYFRSNIINIYYFFLLKSTVNKFTIDLKLWIYTLSYLTCIFLIIGSCKLFEC